MIMNNASTEGQINRHPLLLRLQLLRLVHVYNRRRSRNRRNHSSEQLTYDRCRLQLPVETESATLISAVILM